jgi:hypothetical protein
MERYYSAGVSTLVALMAAHRAAVIDETVSAAFNQAKVAEVNQYLADARAASQRQLPPSPEPEEPDGRA